MRDVRFKSVHRGGELDLHRHRLLAAWAADCAEHVLPLFGAQCPHDDRPRRAIEAARAWSREEATVGQVRAAALEAHAAARETAAGAAQATARAAGQAAGVAHMADHALHAAAYAVKAVQAAAGSDTAMAAENERAWQRERLPAEICALMGSVDQ